ncbi:MAG: tetratricopeptide repeat protein [Bacteroidetes bacterium]|nr:tetratricopeptide repeat protein [Bacteroidota bacterium]
MKKIIIYSLAVIVLGIGTWKFFDYRKNKARNNVMGILNSKTSYVSNSVSSVDRYISKNQEDLKSNPDNVSLLVKTGYAYIQKTREENDPQYYEDAKNFLERAIEINDKNSDAYAGLGSIYLSEHNFKQALETGLKAKELNPYSAYVLSVIVDAQVELGMYEDAIKSAQVMVDTRPDLSSYSRISYIREIHGDLPGAIDAMKMAITAGAPTGENTAWCTVQLGNLYFLSGDREAAKNEYQSALNKYPNYIHALGGLAKIKLYEKDYEGAISLYEKITEKNKLPEYLIMLADTYKITGQIEKAEESYAKVKFINTYFKEKGVDTDLELILFNINQGKNLKDAIHTTEKYISEGNNSFKTFHTLAWAEYKNGNNEEALKNIETALKLGVKDPLMMYHAGKIYEKAGNDIKAKEYTSNALKIYPWLSQTEQQ